MQLTSAKSSALSAVLNTLLYVQSAAAQPISEALVPRVGSAPNPVDIPREFQTRDVGAFYLRVMPLGASIVEGVKSSDGNGFRDELRSQLEAKNWRVNMVGSKQNGNMTDNVSNHTLPSSCSAEMRLNRVQRIEKSWVLTLEF